MNQPPPLQRIPIKDQRKEDADHLNLLAIFHFIVAGLALLGLLVISIQYMFLHTLLEHPFSVTVYSHPGDPGTIVPQPFAPFGVFHWIYLIIGLICVAMGILNLISGFCILARKNRTFSIVVSSINCLQIPFGAVLGAFTIMVLLRESVRELYAERISSAPDA